MENPVSSRGLHPGWVLGRVLLFLAGSMFLFAAASGFAPRGAWHDLIAVSAAALGTYLLTMLFVRWDGVPLRDVGVAMSAWSLPRLAVGFALGMGMVAVQVGVLLATGRVRWERIPETGVHAAAIAFVLFLLVALREELGFRGYPLRRLDAVWGAWAAQLIVGGIFAGEHAVAGYPWKIAVSGVLVGSLLFGAAALVTRGLAVPVGIHLAWNFGSWMIGNKDTPGIWHAVVAPEFIPTAEWVGMAGYWIGVVLVVSGLWWWGRVKTVNSQSSKTR